MTSIEEPDSVEKSVHVPPYLVQLGLSDTKSLICLAEIIHWVDHQNIGRLERTPYYLSNSRRTLAQSSSGKRSSEPQAGKPSKHKSVHPMTRRVFNRASAGTDRAGRNRISRVRLLKEGEGLPLSKRGPEDPRFGTGTVVAPALWRRRAEAPRRQRASMSV